MANEIEFKEFLPELKKILVDSGEKDPKFLLVTCIDLRYPAFIHNALDDFERKGEKPGYFDKRYDHVSLAGAALSAVITFPPHPKPNWSSAFVEQVAISKKLHNIVAVVVLEHRTCGAYTEFGVLPASFTDDEERQAHHLQVRRMAELLKANGLTIPVYSFLLPKADEHARSLRMLQLGV